MPVTGVFAAGNIWQIQSSLFEASRCIEINDRLATRSGKIKRSPLAPAQIPSAPLVGGVKFASIGAGLRYRGRDDLGLIAFDRPANVAAVFTTSTTAGHPVAWCKKMLPRGKARAVIVNAGNANVFRGAEGDQAVLAEATAVAKSLNCRPGDVFVASTGVIGERLPVEDLCAAVPDLAGGLQPKGIEAFAGAIMTTDTFPKWASVEIEIDGRKVAIAGAAKGSGMIAPNMATMLAFVVTDAVVETDTLQKLLAAANERTFNCITVDSDTSTSDTLLIAATGTAGHEPISDENDSRAAAFSAALERVLRDLALLVVRDGEGARKLITVNCNGAVDDKSAKQIAFAVANSPLVKTAIAGADANWGRIVMAIGKSGEPIEQSVLSIKFGGHYVAKFGGAVADLDEAPVAEHLRGREVNVDIIVGNGSGKAKVWTCDLTHTYIDINADYRS